MGYQDLIAWKKSMRLAKECYKLSKKFPKDELYGLTSQIRRASVSIPLNIAEGHTRGTKPQFNHFVSIARGSCAEVETLLLLIKDLEILENNDLKQFELVLTLTLEVGRILNGLQKSLSPLAPRNLPLATENAINTDEVFQ